MTFCSSLRFGKAGEGVVVEWFLDKGYLITDTSEIDGFRMKGLHRDLVLPDLQACKDGTSKWVEVKTKSRDVPYKGQVRQGIEKHYWEEYLGTVAASGIPGWLAILVIEVNLMRLAPFTTLAPHLIPHEGSRAAYRGKELVYWNVDIFDSFDVGDTGIEPMEPKVKHPWSQKPPPNKQQQRYFGF